MQIINEKHSNTANRVISDFFYSLQKALSKFDLAISFLLSGTMKESDINFRLRAIDVYLAEVDLCYQKLSQFLRDNEDKIPSSHNERMIPSYYSKIENFYGYAYDSMKRYLLENDRNSVNNKYFFSNSDRLRGFVAFSCEIAFELGLKETLISDKAMGISFDSEDLSTIKLWAEKADIVATYITGKQQKLKVDGYY